MSNEYHLSVNEGCQTFVKGIFTLWAVLVVLASSVVFAGGVNPFVIAVFAALCVLPVITTMAVIGWGNDWPRGRRALLVCVPWILMSAFFVAVSGGLSSPALVFAAFPPLFALAFEWRRLAVETAVFSLLATLGAIAISGTLVPGAGLDEARRASEMFAFSGLCLLPFLIAGLVAGRSRPSAPPSIQEVTKPANVSPPGTVGLEPVEDVGPGVTIIDVTREGRIRSVSGPALTGIMLGPGKVFLDAFPPELRSRIGTRIVSGGSFTEMLGDDLKLEFTVDRHDLGTRIFLEESGLSEKIEASSVASETDTLKQELAERTAFFAGLGHELKTPLNAILGFSDLMRTELRGPMPEAYKDYAHLIHESGQDLLLIVEDILDFAKAEAGHSRLELEPVDLAASGESVVAQLSSQAERAGVELKMKAKREVWAMADPRAVRQIWQNLVSNAIKYSERGGVVTLDARAGMDAVALSVRDTGAGMSEEDLARIAKPFQQGSNSRGRAGTGLGLAVVQTFVEQMGGKVIIDTAPGDGTRVRVVLPKASSSDVSDLVDAAQ